MFEEIVHKDCPSDLVPTLVMSRAESESVSGNYTSKAFDGEALCAVTRKSVDSFPCVASPHVIRFIKSL